MKTLLLFIAILLIAFLLRSTMLLNGDFWYLSDQARDLLLAKSLVADHQFTLIGGRTGLGGLFHGALWIYLITPFFFIAKGNPFWTLAPIFEIVNLGLVASGFLVGWKLYNKGMGLLFAIFLALSKELVNVSSGTTNAEVFPIVFIFYLYSMIRFLRKDEKYFAISLFLIGLGFQFESAFAVLLIPITIIAILLRKKVPQPKTFLLGIVGFLTAVSTFILFDIRHQFLMTTSAIKLFTNIQKPLPGYEQYANIGFRFIDRITNLWNSLFTPLYSRNVLVDSIVFLFIVVSILILLKKIYSKQVEIFEKEFIFILLCPLLVFGAYILYPLPLWPHYLLPTAVIAIFILGLSIKILWAKPIIKPLIVLFLALAVLPALSDIKNFYSASYSSNTDGSYINQLTVAKWVFNDSQNKKAGYFVYTPGILTYNMDYIFWWLSYNNKKDQLTSIKTDNTYLIMYPPQKEDPGAHNFWKENVIKTDAKPIKTKKFDSGIIVEKIDLSKDKLEVDPNYFQNLIFR